MVEAEYNETAVGSGKKELIGKLIFLNG